MELLAAPPYHLRNPRGPMRQVNGSSRDGVLLSPAAGRGPGDRPGGRAVYPDPGRSGGGIRRARGRPQARLPPRPVSYAPGGSKRRGRPADRAPADSRRAPHLAIEDCEFGHLGICAVWFRKGCRGCDLKRSYLLASAPAACGSAGQDRRQRAGEQAHRGRQHHPPRRADISLPSACGSATAPTIPDPQRDRRHTTPAFPSAAAGDTAKAWPSETRSLQPCIASAGACSAT